jgi:ATP-dependent DNA helicase PIF1
MNLCDITKNFESLDISDYKEEGVPEDKPKDKPKHQITLNKKQQYAYDCMVEGKNVFLTGPSGTGKSLIINKFKDEFRYIKHISITSTTGISALLIGGTTLHRYLGIGLGKDSVENMVKDIQRKPFLKKRWNSLQVLIIDEVSMLSPILFDKLEEVARIVRRGPVNFLRPIPDLPFGGIQLILTGDFLQLPVVGSTDFCFESKAWDMCINQNGKSIHLTEIMRQEDSVFQNVLNELRFAKISEESKKILRGREDFKLLSDTGIRPTKIMSTNYEIDIENEREIQKLIVDHKRKTGEDLDFREYTMEIYFFKKQTDKNASIERLKKNCLASETLQLCIGAQVMLICNLDLDSGLANGSRGVIVDFVEDFPLVRFLNGEERVIGYNAWEIKDGTKNSSGEEELEARITQVPLKVAFSISCHRIQGSTLDFAIVDLSKIFEYGQAYVAISRVKTLEGLSLHNLDFSVFKANPKAVEFYNRLDREF